MYRHPLTWLVLGSAVLLAGGCDRTPPPPPPPTGVSAATALDKSFASLLDQSRADLAKQAGQLQDEVLKAKNDQRRNNKLVYQLAPYGLTEVPQPLVVPTFQKAKFDEGKGVSIPAHAENAAAVAGDKDLLKVYASYGDLDAVAKLAGDAAKAEYAQYDLGKNYPVEWTRLVALTLYLLAEEAAQGDDVALRNLVKAHNELADLLKDKKVQSSPLGRTLLPLGRRTTTLALDAWRARVEKEGLGDEKGRRAAALKRPAAEQQGAYNLYNRVAGGIPAQGDKPAEPSLLEAVQAALPGWPVADPVITLAGTKAEWAAKLGLKEPPPGRMLLVKEPARAFDLLQLPFPVDDAEAVLLFFEDEAGALYDVYAVYGVDVTRGRRNAASLLGFIPRPRENERRDPNQAHAEIAWGDLQAAADLLTADAPVGGWAHVARKVAGQTPRTVRQLGPVSLDRPFHANRLHVARHEVVDSRGELVVSDPPGLAELAKVMEATKEDRDRLPLPKGPIQELVLTPGRQDQYLLQKARFRYVPSDKATSAAVLLEPAQGYLGQFGPGTWDFGPAAGRGEGLAFQIRWELPAANPVTRLTFQILYNGKAPQVEIADLRDDSQSAERVASVRANESLERQQRFKEKDTSWTFLPRDLELMADPHGLKLGMTREAVTRILPKEDLVAVIDPAVPGTARDVPADTLLIVNVSNKAAGRDYVARQWVLRFQKSPKDPKGPEVLAQIRVRYESAANPTDWVSRLRNEWETKYGRSTEWAHPLGRRPGFQPPSQPASAKPYLLHWRDDQTDATFAKDLGGVEVAITDRAPPEYPEAEINYYSPPVFLPRLSPLLPRVYLGMPEADLQALGFQKDTTTGDTFSRAGGRAELVGVHVTVNSGRVTAITVRHRVPRENAGAAEMAKLLTETWGQEVRQVGYPLRKEFSAQDIALQKYLFMDARTTHVLFWTTDGEGKRALISQFEDVTLTREAGAPGGSAASGGKPPAPSPVPVPVPEGRAK